MFSTQNSAVARKLNACALGLAYCTMEPKPGSSLQHLLQTVCCRWDELVSHHFYGSIIQRRTISTHRFSHSLPHRRWTGLIVTVNIVTYLPPQIEAIFIPYFQFEVSAAVSFLPQSRPTPVLLLNRVRWSEKQTNKQRGSNLLHWVFSFASIIYFFGSSIHPSISVMVLLVRLSILSMSCCSLVWSVGIAQM